VYQGSEILMDSLVDPDNRRPVDHASIAATLAELDDGRNPDDLSEEKLRLTAAILRLRARRPEAFVGESAGYSPLPVTTQHAVAFARTVAGRKDVAVVGTRLAAGLAALGGFGEHTVVLPEGEWRDIVSDATYAGGPVRLADLTDDCPAVVLERAR
jgi:(1->4)-alpha-D-glucan 1-alpha-D-glucosylmutase